MKKGILILLFSVVLVINLGFVFGVHIITTSSGGTSYSVRQNIPSVYNLTVNNTDSYLGPIANITQVNISLFNGAVFTINTNGSNAAPRTFSNTSTNLIWLNDTNFLVGCSGAGANFQQFWFNLTAYNAGDYNLTIRTTNTTGIYSSNISVHVNDTVAPSTVTFIAPTSDSNISGTTYILNVTVSDSFSSIGAVSFNITNSTGNVTARITATNTSATSWNATLDTTLLGDGLYNLTIIANDSAGNLNNTATTLNIRIDNTRPVITLSSPADGSSSTDTVSTLSYVVSENYPTNCSLILDGLISNFSSTINFTGGTNSFINTSAIGGHSWSINCTDNSGNIANSSTWGFSVGEAQDDGSGGGGGTPSFWINTLAYNDKELSVYGSISKEIKAKERVRIKINGQNHEVGVIGLTSNSVTFNVSSAPQQATLNIGESRKFELTGDHYYDIQVKLNSINATSNKANLTITSINESTSSGPLNLNSNQNNSQSNTGNNGTGGLNGDNNPTPKNNWIIWIAIIVVVVLVAIGLFLWYGKKNSNN